MLAVVIATGVYGRHVEGELAVFRLARAAAEQATGNEIVTVLEDVCRDFDDITKRAFDWIPASIEFGRDVLDDQARQRA